MNKRMLLAVLCSAFFAQSAGAAVIKQSATDGISVSGNIERSSSKEVLVTIFGPFDTKKEYSSAIGDTDKMYVNAVYADENMKYSFNYKPLVNNKFYAISVTNSGKQETAELFYADNSLIEMLLNDINGASDIGLVFEKNEYEDVLINNYSLFISLSEAQKECVYKDISENKKNGYQKFDDFETVYLKATVVQSLNNLADEGTAKTLAELYLPLDDISLYGEYNKYSEEEKINVFERILSRNISGIEEFYKIINESVFLEKIQNEEFSSNLTSFIIQNASGIGLNISGYDTISNSVNSAINKKYFKTFDEFKTFFNAALGTSGNSYGGGSGSSSGGSSGGASGSTPNGIYLKPVAEEKNNAPVFNDLEGVLWAKDAIMSLSNKGIISGKDDGKFSPADLITREEFVQMAVGAFNLKSDDLSCDFADVKEDNWFYKSVSTAVKENIISGISENEFGTGMNITRQDIATILYRIGEKNSYKFSSDDALFADDVDISDYAKQGVYALRTAGVISGLGDNNFGAKKNATRAEAAMMIYKMMEVLS